MLPCMTLGTSTILLTLSLLCVCVMSGGGAAGGAEGSEQRGALRVCAGRPGRRTHTIRRPHTPHRRPRYTHPRFSSVFTVGPILCRGLPPTYHPPPLTLLPSLPLPQAFPPLPPNQSPSPSRPRRQCPPRPPPPPPLPLQSHRPLLKPVVPPPLPPPPHAPPYAPPPQAQPNPHPPPQVTPPSNHPT